MIFDEIDTGISGHVAQAVAEKMASIGRYHQVLCVTHLAQIAAMADAQYLVQKQVTEGRTRTTVRLLDEEGRVEEVARLIGVTESQQESGMAHRAPHCSWRPKNGKMADKALGKFKKTFSHQAECAILMYGVIAQVKQFRKDERA